MFRQGAISAIWNCIRNLTSGADGVSGAALVEFTLFAPILLATAIYAMEFVLLAYYKMEVQNASQAGIQYAIATNAYDSGQISTAVTGATKFTAVTSTSSEFCGCPTATSVTCWAASCYL